MPATPRPEAETVGPLGAKRPDEPWPADVLAAAKECVEAISTPHTQPAHAWEMTFGLIIKRWYRRWRKAVPEGEGTIPEHCKPSYAMLVAENAALKDERDWARRQAAALEGVRCELLSDKEALTAKLAEAEKYRDFYLRLSAKQIDRAVELESQLAAAQGEVERWKRLHDLEAKCSGVVSYQLDRIREHFDKDGDLLGEGRWRLTEILACVKVMIAADDEANRAMDEIEDGESAARQGQERGE
jgi:hypothetical protein